MNRKERRRLAKKNKNKNKNKEQPPQVAATSNALRLMNLWRESGQADKANEMFEMIARGALELRKQDEGSERIRDIHETVDGMVEGTMATSPGTKPSCRRGCSFCCYNYVRATPEEGALLVQVAAEKGIKLDVATLERQAAMTDQDYLKNPEPCVFLDKEGGCLVYEDRPTACRVYLVSSDPALCDTVNNKGKNVTVFLSVQAEILASAQTHESLLRHGSLGNLAKRLLGALRKQESGSVTIDSANTSATPGTLCVK